MACTKEFLNGCAGKLKHKTWFAADYFLKNEHIDPLAQIYKCRCGFFHIGGRKNNKGEKIIKHKKREVNDQQHKRKHKRFKY